MRNFSFIATLVIAALAVQVDADQVILKNGDHISGEIKTVLGGKLAIKTGYAGVVSIAMEGIKTFSVDKALKLVLKDGQELSASKAFTDETGKIRIATDTGAKLTADASQSRLINFSDIESINPPPVKWTGSLSAGATLTRGNSIQESANVSFAAVRNTKYDRIKVGASYDFGRSKDKDTRNTTTTQDSWEAFAKYDRFFSKHFYGYATGKIKHDRLAELDFRLTPGAGVGYQWLRSGKTNLGTELGASWVYEKFRDNTPTEKYVAARAAYEFDTQITDNVKFFHNLEYLPSLEDTRTYLINTDAGMKITINAHLFTELKAVVNYNSQPSGDSSNTDVKYIANIGLTF